MATSTLCILSTLYIYHIIPDSRNDAASLVIAIKVHSDCCCDQLACFRHGWPQVAAICRCRSKHHRLCWVTKSLDSTQTSIFPTESADFDVSFCYASSSDRPVPSLIILNPR